MLRSVAQGLAVAGMLGLAGCQTLNLGTPSPAPQPSAPQPAPAPSASKSQPTAPTTPAVVTPAEAQVKVALLVPLSGSSAAVGQALLNAAQLALFDTAGAKFTLIPLDTQGTVEGSRQAALQATQQGAQLILGPLFGADVPAVLNVARPLNVPVISFSTDPSVAGHGAFVIGVLLREQARRVVEEANARGLTRFAALVPDNAYGHMIGEAYAEAVTRVGGKMVSKEYFPPNSTEQTAQVVQRLANLVKTTSSSPQQAQQAQQAGILPFDVLLIPEGGQKLKELTSLLTYYEVDVRRLKLVGPMLWDDPQIWRDPVLEGAWFPAPVPATHQAFVSRYLAAFGQTPPAIASLGYDATALAGVLARRPVGLSTPYTGQTLLNPNGFAGVDGLFRFLTDGTSQRGLAVMEIRSGSVAQVGEAPRTFMGQATMGQTTTQQTPASPAPASEVSLPR